MREEEYREAGERVRAAFAQRMGKDAEVEYIRKKANNSTATYADAIRFASRSGVLVGELIRSELLEQFQDGRVPLDAAQAILQPGLLANYEQVSDVACDVAKVLNEKAGIHLKPQAAEYPADKVDNLAQIASKARDFRDMADVFPQYTENQSLAIVDDTVRANASFHYQMGLSPKITRRTASRACKWCAALAGTFNYPGGVPKDVWRRHRDCRCLVEYDPGNGARKAQNVHTKAWRSKQEREAQDKRIERDREEQDRLMRRDEEEKRRRETEDVKGREAARLIASARKHEPTVTADLQSAVKTTGAHLSGLDYRIKGEDSLKRKLETKARAKGIAIEDYSRRVTDALRYTSVSETETFVDDYRSIVDAMARKGYTEIEVTNTLKTPDAIYRGVNTLMKTDDGYVFELQYHTPESLKVKEVNHKLYEEHRQDNTSEKRKQELTAQMILNSMRIHAPIEVEMIEEIK